MNYREHKPRVPDRSWGEGHPRKMKIDPRLWDSAEKGYEDLVRKFIEQGAKVDWRDIENNSTALHEAAKGGHTPVVTQLLDAGWSLEARNECGDTPLTIAALWGQLEARDSNGM